jgi:hypothetical protein
LGRVGDRVLRGDEVDLTELHLSKKYKPLK